MTIHATDHNPLGLAVQSPHCLLIQPTLQHLFYGDLVGDCVKGLI